jgi:drug/metabolite transporter (DMT)-like permease
MSVDEATKVDSIRRRILAKGGQGWRIPAALGATYLFFGSGPAAVKAAIISLPPLGLVAVRGLTAGAFLLALSVASGAKLPSRRQWVASLLIGVLILTLGTGCGTLGQRTVPSGIAGVLTALLPRCRRGVGGNKGGVISE